MKAHGESLGYYLKEYPRYIIPTWLFPIYFLAFGLVCEHLHLNSWAIVLFCVIVLPAFFGTFFWARVPSIPMFKRWVLTMLIPFLIFAVGGFLLFIIATLMGRNTI